jgi:hypothetical protein
MRKPTLLLPLALAAALAACNGKPPAAAAPVDPAAAYVVHAWPLPATEGSAQPDMAMTADGRLLLSWISSLPGRRNALQFVSLAENGRWQSAPRTIAVGESMLANWADTPHIAATGDGALWVHWLQRTGDGYAYDVALSRSTDAGFNWSPPVLVNDDGTKTEHGFVAMWPAADDRLGIAWLDGRAMAGEEPAPHDDRGTAPHAHPGGAMTLRAAVFDGAMQRSDEQVIDAMTCDCCQTSVAVTSRGPLLVYRDRTDGEIRDIAATRFDGSAWSTPKPVHADGWKMPACPVNGPAVAAEGDDAVVAWYTAEGDDPRVQVARSNDAGDSFGAPVVLDRGEAVQGRVAVALDPQQAWILWLREDAAGQSLWLSRRSPDLSREYQRVQVATLQGRGRGTGFPQLALRGPDAHVVWTDVVDGVPRLQGAIVSPAASSP